MRLQRVLPCAAVFAVMCSAGCGRAPAGASGSGDEPRANTDSAAASPTRRAPEQGAITGRVLSAGGEPLAGCSVLPTATSRPRPPVPEMAVMTNADGRYRWPLHPATYTVTAYCELPKYDDGQRTGRVTGVVVTAGHEVTADITVA